MIKLIINSQLILFLLLITISPINAQWEKVTNIDDRYLIDNYWLDVYFLPESPNYGWICGYRGATLRTTDGGETWTSKVIPNVDQLESIHFPSRNVGYTSGEGQIFKTTDGGDTWYNITPNDNYTPLGNTRTLLWGNYFVTEDYGFVIGGGCGTDQQVFYRTTNGGESWMKQVFNEPETKLSDLIVESTGGVGWAVSSGLLWKTLDGGRSWQPSYSSGNNDWHEELAYYNNSFLLPYSVGCHGTLSDDGSGGMRFSTNGGLTWNLYVTDSKNYGSFLLDEKRGWVCGTDEAIYYTSDAGRTWELINCGLDPGASLDDIRFIDDTTGWVVGQGIYKYRVPRPLEPKILVDEELDLCEGEEITLSVDQDYEYIRWKDGSSRNSLTIKESGIYWYHAENIYCDEGYSDTVIVNIRPKTPIHLSVEPALKVCDNDTVNISIKEDFQKYLWNTGDTTSSIQVNKSGIYSVVATNKYGCESTAEVNIEVLPSPEIESCCPYNVCVGYEQELVVTDGYDSYKWYKTKSNTVRSSTNVYMPEESGRYYCVVTNENGCETISDTITVTIRDEKNQFAISSNTDKPLDFGRTIFPNDKCVDIYLINISNEDYILNEATFRHKFSFTAPLAQFPILIPAKDSIALNVCYWPGQVGIERDTIDLPDNCTDHTIPMVAEGQGRDYEGNSKCDIGVILKTIAINKQYAKSSAPYPNPANSIAYVDFQSAGEINEIEAGTCKVFNCLGQKVAEFSPIISNTEHTNNTKIISGYFRIDLVEFVQGVYYITYENNAHKKIYPLIIQR